MLQRYLFNLINLFNHNEIVNATDTSKPPQKIHIQIGYIGIYLLVADKVNQGDLLSPPSYLHFPANALLSLFRLLKMDSAVFL